MEVFDELGKRLYLEFRQANAASDREWMDLAEHEREFYRTVAEGLILDWDLILRAHAAQILAGRHDRPERIDGGP